MFNHKEIEKKWQLQWEESQTFKTTDKSDKKFYVLDMFPYPSGSGLHVGHPEGYTATDIVARYKRLNGFDVLHPIGWDAFGLPAEQYAIKTGNHPKGFTKKNIANFRRQLKSLGFSYDYNKEVDTTDPAYFKTTQWIFSQLYKKGLAEIRDIEVNWCEGLGTVLANEEVNTLEDGSQVSERGDFPVVRKPMKQWVLKITEYADALFQDLDQVNWPNGLKALQRNWIKNEDGSLHLRDWIFSRQRYWGEPFPIAFDENNDIFLIEDLPVELPEMTEIKPSGTGESPLANATDWLNFEKDGKKYRRETNTMPQWAGSSWYYLAYILKNDDGTYLPIDSPEAKERFAKWLPVDLYVGGQEHATLHLLYARFWHKVLYDLGIVPTKEPFFRIVNQGMILGTDGQKMSKSKGNVINPDEIVEEFGADTLRIYEMFMGPLEDTKAWSTDGVAGIRRWLDRVYRLYEAALDENNDLFTVTKPAENNTCPIPENGKYKPCIWHIFVKEVTEDIENLKFNVAISKMMVFINALYKKKTFPGWRALKYFAVVLSLFAPHLAEELLAKMNQQSVSELAWPTYDERFTQKNEMEIAVQVNGKLRATLSVEPNISKEDIIAMAKEQENVQKFLTGNIVKEIYVPGRIVNIVVK